MFGLLLVLSTASAQQQCSTCKYAATAAKAELLDKGGLADIDQILEDLCVKVAGEALCKDLYVDYGEDLLAAGVERILEPEWFCWKTGMCNSPTFVTASKEAWAKNALAGKPSNKTPSSKSKARMYFTHLTDIYLDTAYLEGSNASCDDRVCCQEGTPSSASHAAGQYGNYNCDLPMSTVSMAIEKIGATQNNFVVWTGNTPSHILEGKTKASTLAAITSVTQRMQANLKTVPVYPAIGPMDCYPPGQFNFLNGDPMASSLNTLWKNWLPSTAQTTFKTSGYYSALHPNSKLRIVALNTLACFRYNTNLVASPEDPGNQLSWLNSTLLASEKNGEAVLIIGSIAPADPLCTNDWSYRYSALVDRFENIIRGQVFGNAQVDKLHITRGPLSGQGTVVQLISPSLSSFKGLNPSYRIYELNAESYVLTNYFQYRLDLVKANSVPGTTFKLIYNFADFYLSKDLSVHGLEFWIKTLRKSELRFLKYLSNYYAGGASTPTSCGATCQADTYCMMMHGTEQSIRDCQELPPSPAQWFADQLIGNWTQAVTS
jgi:sphingomyelin phosphodiesterase